MAATTGKKPHVARVLIVDDHPVVRLGYSDLINHQPDLQVCGEAADVSEAIAQLESAQPDLVIVDISLKDSDGLDLIRQVKAKRPATKLLIVSAHDEALFAERGLRAGAIGYVNKEEAIDRLIEAIRRVLRGEIYIRDSVATRMMCRAIGRKADLQRSPVETLSDRELETFRLLGQGYNTRKIAEQMGLSFKTVECYRENIKKKLNIKSAAELVRHAVQWVLDSS
jgi:DNA-binding NarL/FixJ family response regulator